MIKRKIYITGAIGSRAVIPPDTDLVLAFERVASELKVPFHKEVLPYPVEKALEVIEEKSKKKTITVVLSGDPLFFGLGERIKELIPEARIVPSTSYVQYAFSLIGKSWNNATVLSLHARRITDLLKAMSGKESRIFVFTDKKNTPDTIARYLIKTETPAKGMWVFERLGLSGERYGFYSLEEASQRRFSYPNCLIVEKEKIDPPSVWEDTAYEKREGTLTKKEIRGILKSIIPEGDVLWDIGAGTGSVAITLAEGYREVYAVEERCPELVKENRKRFGTWHVIPVAGRAPEALEKLPDPTNVFVGSGHRELVRIIEAIVPRVKSKITASFVSEEGVAAAFAVKRRFGGRILHINLCDYSERLPRPRIPVWIWERST